MQDFIDWISSIFDSLFTFFENFITSIIDFLKLIPTLVQFATDSIANLPAMIMTFATITISISVVLLVLGRSNN